MLVACRDPPAPTSYLGDVDAGSYNAGSDYVPNQGSAAKPKPDTSVDAPALQTNICDFSINFAGSTKPTSTALNDILYFSDDTTLYSAELNEGCPNQTSVKTISALDVGAIRSTRANQDQLVVLGSSGLAQLSADATVLSSCSVSGRSLAQLNDKSWWVSQSNSSIVQVDLTANGCNPKTTKYPDPITAIAPSSDGKLWVGVLINDDNLGTVARIKKLNPHNAQFDSTLQLGDSGVPCTIDELIEIDSQLFVVDGGCGRVLSYGLSSGSVVGVVQLETGHTPTSVVNSQQSTLIFSTESAASGKQGVFLKLD